MQKYREVVSDIISTLKANNVDDKMSLSYRFILFKFMDKADIFLKQDADQRKILKINGLWKPLNPIELIDDSNVSNNLDLLESYPIKRSRKKIPITYSTNFGSLIKILNVNNSLEYKQIRPFDYKEIQRREYINKRVKYFWIDDGYLYIPDSDVEQVRGFGLFRNSLEADHFNGKIDCCYKPLDSDILLPDYIISLSKTETIKELLGSLKQIQEDEFPNSNNSEKVSRK